ncbi:37S ribosomal protein S23, mitochondrial [Pseudocercospora fuligena]|uniref:Small ribosomal subunit protein mS29 n=1 Tax=Pseudocercospora fuligena TaxID=685502 RepID=A0A8H6VLE8_9PEZI|nr:37S ribosomal protein S23, mitochondrial [Pseudocercospora fuligena]
MMQTPMPPSMCLRCLKRSLNAIETSIPNNAIQRSAFSTTTSLSAQPVQKKKGVVAKPASRAGKTLRLNKNKRASTTRPPAVGERKALRKRVVLSNTNALEIQGLPDLDVGNINSQVLQKYQGSVLGLKNPTVDALRAAEAFKPTQGWSLFRRPATLIRKETVDVAGDIEWVAAAKAGRTVRKVIYGERDSGKSVLQLQAMAMASLRNWVVVHIPEAQDLVNAHTSYEPIETEDGTMYVQPHYTAKLLDNIAKANRNLLETLKMKQQHKLPISLPANSTLLKLAELGARDPDAAWPVWQAFWTELTAPGDDLPPVFYSLDGFDHVSRLSAYLNSDVQPIHAHELTLVKHFIDMLSGKTPLPNGGVMLAAVSESNKASAHTLHHCIKRNEAIQSKKPAPAGDPYVAYDKWVQDAVATVGVTKLKGLSKEEARGVMQYYAQSGMLRNGVTENLVSETWTLSGGGIIGQIERGTVQALRA